MKIIKIKDSEGSLGKNNGCEKAPDQIIKELKNIWLCEDFKLLNYSEDECSKEKIKDGFIYLGGDHSISYHTIKNLAAKSKNFGLIVFDAHPDVYQEFKFPTHEDWLYYLLEEKIIKKENVIILGIRASDEKEIEYLQRNKIKFYTSKQLYLDRDNICDSVMERVREFSDLYLSIDIDFLDPAFAPGTGYMEPGGASTRDLLYFIQRLKLLKNLKAADIVEVNPDKDINDMTSKTAAKIIGELL